MPITQLISTWFQNAQNAINLTSFDLFLLHFKFPMLFQNSLSEVAISVEKKTECEGNVMSERLCAVFFSSCTHISGLLNQGFSLVWVFHE